jgi:hypothetical protein
MALEQPIAANIFIVPAREKTPKPKDGYQRFLADHVDGLDL